jgi:outer membrane lipoprotein SlyB
MLTTLALTVALAGHPQLINPPAQGPIARHIQQTVFHETPRAVEAPFAQAGSRDSLKNGAVIGAVVGGVATGLFIGYLCHVFNDNDMNCWPPALLYAAGGAGAGALVGAGVDALFQRRVGVRIPIKF